MAINSSLVSAQNRLRLYWTNILTLSTPHLFGETVRTAVPQPEDKGVYLRDILDDEADARFFLSRKDIDKLERQIAYESESQDFRPEESFMDLFRDDDFCETYATAPASCFCPENWISSHTIRPSPDIERFPLSAVQRQQGNKGLRVENRFHRDNLRRNRVATVWRRVQAAYCQERRLVCLPRRATQRHA